MSTRTRSRRYLFACAWALGVLLLLPAVAAAWDSPIPTYNSHYQAAEKAIRDLLADPKVSADVKGPISQFKAILLSGSENEECHKKNAITTGSNCGTTHPELWWKSVVASYRNWQKTGNPDSRTRAYEVLGKLLHAVEDQGAAPHAIDREHGGGWPSQFEILSTLLTFNSAYYVKPDDWNHPGKSVVDGYGYGVMSGWHTDDAEFRWGLKPDVWTYRDLGSVNLQMPAPTRMCFDTSIINLAGAPDKCYIRVVYDVIPSSPCPAGVKVQPGSNGTMHVKEFGPFSPRAYKWTRFTLSDAFAPNGIMNIDWKRAEDGFGYVTSTAQLQVYVTNTRNVAAEMPRPKVQHPWEYYDWLRAWTAWSIASPYWRGYYALTNDAGAHDFTIVPDLAPNTERALISMQWASTAKVAQWFLEDAQAKLNDPTYAVADAEGHGYRVVFYEDSGFNPTDAEYRYTQTVAAEPYTGNGPYFVPPDTATPQAPLVQRSWQVQVPSAAEGAAPAVMKNPTMWLGYDHNTNGMRETSSIEVDRAKVRIYDQPSYRGASIVITGNARDLSAIGWNDRVKSAVVTPFYIELISPFTAASGDEVALSGFGFGAATGGVAFGSSPATVKSWSDREIVCAVPSGVTGTVDVAVTCADGTAPGSASFTVAPPPAVTPTLTLKLSGLKSRAITLGRSVTAGGAATPLSLAASKVKLTVQRKSGIKWAETRTGSATISSTGAYSWKYRPTRKGAYRVQAKIAKTSVHAAATTVWRTFKVK